ncbi:putative heme-binding domain-containing protein [Rhodopirellula rubra]|uniref:Putative heme-binding domain-containing protein n=1 Tax=Aporhodopirellula rubra TaxID=980271 RepID=A0A7W5DZP2_9BACT|nr:PVC-type heme-binding CxxCH protein [Aporhodopirellula rubra]MBB3207420.1 putative heme-binding domain-containing protein [Aporhodopirellula rubra]
MFSHHVMPHRFFALIAFLVASVSFPGDAAAKELPKIKTANQRGADLDLMNNHDPASERENFELLPGYEVNLFASDPMLANPIHMHWDSRGRLWVACSWAYPQLKPGEVANDKIIILEDTDGDGAADKSTVFADGLYLPTGIEFANGGCYVAQSPDVFFLKDTDGDDVADVKELVLTGFGIEDSHHSISAWRRGPGGWIYFQEGIFLHAQVETQYGVVRNFNGGVYQFNPKTQELRVFCTGTGGNPWGHVFDRWGQSFMVNNPRIMYLSPWTGNSGDKLQIKPLISTEKQCGGDLATGSHIGDDLQGQLLTCRFKSRAVIRYELIENGAGFSANVLQPLMTSKHPNFRPVDVKIGPDGAIYVADWYNSIINHAQHDFRDPRRDHEHGRIWRITHKERPLVTPTQLTDLPLNELVEHLQSPEDFVRHQTRYELSLRDPDEVVTAVEAWVDSLDSEKPSYDQNIVEAMWAIQNVERSSENVLTRVLNAEDGHARSAGARVIRYWHADLSDPIAMIAKASDDPFPRTRMEAVLSAGFIPQAEAFVAALNSLNHPGDSFLDHALPQTMSALEPYWRPALDAGRLQFAKPSHQEYVERGVGVGLEKRLTAFLDNDSPTEKEIAEIQSQIRKSASDADIRTLVDALTKGQSRLSTETSLALLATLQELSDSKWPRSTTRSLRKLSTLTTHPNEAVAVAAVQNLGAWRVAGRAELAGLRDSGQRTVVRRALAVALAKTNPRYESNLVQLAGDGDLAGKLAAIAGLAHCNLDLSVSLSTELLAEDPGDADVVPLIEAIVRQREGTEALSKALTNANIHPAVVSRLREFHRETGSLPNAIIDQLPAATNASLSASLLAEDPAILAKDVAEHGDAARGELIYRRKTLACTNCHAIGSAGAEIGPNLVAVGAAAKPGYLIESILHPNAAIAEHYENKLFLLADGSVQTGIVTFQNDKEIVVRDAAAGGKEIRIDADEVEFERPQPSAMPAGLADQLNDRPEFLDLAKFLSVLGTPGPYANNETPVFRKWRLLEASEKRTAFDAKTLPADDDAAWMTAYSKVDGVLPREDMPANESVIARGFVNVLVAGQVELAIESGGSLEFWIDDQKLSDPASPVRLDVGRHAVTLRLRPSEHPQGIRVEFKPADATVRFQAEGGV